MMTELHTSMKISSAYRVVFLDIGKVNETVRTPLDVA